jgi:branched-chain amino acid transport system substrate-binding protein
VAQPDWIILRAGGVMTWTALKEAAQVGFPRDKIVGSAPTCTEQDMVQAGEAAIDFICVTFLGTGTDFPLIQAMRQYVYARGKGPGPEGDIGTDRWKRGVLDAVVVTEGIRTAMRHFGNQPLTGAQVQWGSSTSPSLPHRSRSWGQTGCSHRLPCPAAIMRGVGV